MGPFLDELLRKDPLAVLALPFALPPPCFASCTTIFHFVSRRNNLTFGIMESSTATQALKKYFGYETFRPMQAEIIQAIYEEKDALVLMPTGGGKSICYQVPAITMPGACVVVSPLISLMKDQVEGLLANGVQAAFLNSSLNSTEQSQVEEAFYQGLLDILYVSPEKLVSQNFLPFLKRTDISLFAIDEAHCISAWGHDFRPEYTKMRFLKREFPNTPIVALTATADKLTRQDIIDQLHLRKPEIFIASFDRPNLSLEVRPGQKRFDQILQFVRKHPNQPGIIYCLSRKNTEKIAEKLNDAGLAAAHYHAGLGAEERSRVQEAFTNDNTLIAFGMGIDKSNVRWVIHYNLPKNIESYYQEIGRAGRDGAQAATLLFYSFGDVTILRDILQKNESDNTALQLAKLDRMREYAESLACRRRILLAYFGEDYQGNCNNCDICRNPPQYFDGTVIAQKALSAIYRLRQKVAMRMLINVLRGANYREIFEKGYHEIKTFGAGKEIAFTQWQFYVRQLINLGYLEIAYDDRNALKLTDASLRVLFEDEKVELVKLTTVKERQEAEKERVKPANQRQRVRDELFEELRQLRRRISQEQGVPPYIVFNDATLEEMAAEKPLNAEQMRRVSGVGEKKLHQYGQIFIDAILEFLNQGSSAGKASPYEQTKALYQRGLGIEQIAKRRGLPPETIVDHLIRLQQSGQNIDFTTLIDSEAVERVGQLIKYMDTPRLKDIHEGLDGTLEYYQIRLALACLQKKESYTS